MAKKGDTPQDYRSEAERIRPRPAGSLFKEEPESLPGEIERVVHGTYREIHSDESLSPSRLLLKRVVRALSSETDLSTSDITVEVRGHTVLLTGSVDTMNTKYRAEETVKRLEEVAHIENQLAVRLGDALDEFTRGADASRLREEFARTTKKH
jgi:hypothetical protein